MLSSLKYRPEIDGLRALAVIPVVFFHLGMSFPGGFIGVDIFFVISGYLITGIILSDLSNHQFSIIAFYSRRVRRIIPALAFMLLGVLTFASWQYFPWEMDQLGKYLTAVSTFLANVSFYNSVFDYWSPRAEQLPLLHTWTLAVEEQYYIVIPILLLLIHGFAKKLLIHILIMLFLISFTYSVYYTSVAPKFAFYMLPTRAWELLVGAGVLVYTVSKRPSFLNLSHNSVGIFGLILITGAFFSISKETPFPGFAALVPVLGTAFIIIGNTDTLTISGRLLSLKPLRLIGKISYSLYLWHWPLYVFFVNYRYPNELSPFDKILVLLASFLMAFLSWKFVETPFRMNCPGLSPNRIVRAGIIVLSFFLAISLLLRYTDGLPSRFAIRFHGEILNLILSDVPDRAGSNRFQAGNYFAAGGLQFHTDAYKSPNLVVIGDSHGAMIAPVISSIAVQYKTPIAFYTHDGRKPFFDGDATSAANIERMLRQWHPAAILLIMRWDNLWGQGEDTIRLRIQTLSTSCSELYIVTQVPKITNERVRAAKFLFHIAKKENWQLPKLRYAHGKENHQRTLEFLGSLMIPNLHILDVNDVFVRGDTLRFHNHGKLYYRDDDHLNLSGAMQTRQLFEPILRASTR